MPGVCELIEPWPICRALMRYGAVRRLPDQARILCERACPMSRRSRLPGLPPICKLTLIQQNVHPPRAGVDPDQVAVADQGQGTADEGFGRHIADAHAARCTGEASVGGERSE